MSREDTVKRISHSKINGAAERNISVLLIGGDSDVIRLAERVAGRTERGQIRLDHALSLSDGLDCLSVGDIDVIVLDSLPNDLSDPEALVRISENSPHVPVIILCDGNDDRSASALFGHGAYDILKKAEITADRLVGAIRSAAAYKRGQVEVRQSTEKLRAFFWGIPVPTYIWKHENDDFTLTDYNNAALAITEGRISGFVGQPVSRMYGDVPEIIDDMHRCYHERVTVKKEVLYHFQSTGRDRYLEVTYGFVPPDLVLVHTVDITERKEAVRILRQFNSKLEATVHEQTARLTATNEELAAEIEERTRAQEALAESERRYRLLVENASEGIIVVQQDRIVFANPRAIEAMGYPAEELTARHLMDFVHPDDRGKVLDYHLKGLAGENPPPMTYRIVNRDGNVFWAEVDGVLIEWGGKPSGLLFYKDVTDRMEAQEALRESEEKYRLVVENADEGIIISQATHMRFVNPKVVKDLGYTEEELKSRPFIDLIHPDDREMVMRHHLDGISGKKVDPTISYRIFDRNGTLKWIEVTGVAITWENEPCVLLFVKDISDRKKTEEVLRESEEKYRLVVENANEGIGINQDGIVAFVNPRLCEITGYTREELIGKPFTYVVHPDERETAQSRFRQMTEGKNIELPYPYRLVDKEGNIKWIEVNSVSVSWQGKPAVLIFVDDVTQRKSQEDKLRESESRYRELVENTSDLVYAMDGEGNFELVNRTIEREYGYSASDLVGKGFKDIVKPDSYESIAQVFKKQLKGIDVGAFEFDLYDKNGNTRTVESRERLVWEGKRVAEVHGIARDVTERKRAEAALRESEEKYRLVVENASEGIVVVQGTTMQYINPKIAEWTGFTREELASRPFLDFIPPDDHELVIKQHLSVLEGKGQLPFITHRVLNREGNFLWIEVSGVLVEWQGSPATLLFVKDVTERKRIEEALRESEEKYRLVVENADEVITIAVGDHLKFANRKALEISGYTGKEASTIPVIEMIHPDDRQMVLEYKRRRDGGEKEPQSFTMRLIKKDGQTIWLQNSVVPVLWEGNLAALNVATDVTKQKRIEDALRESEENYRLVVENADEVIIVSVDGYLQLFNRRTVELFGYPEDDLLSRPVIEFFHPDDRAFVLDYRKQREEGEQQHQFFTARMVTRDGRTVWMQCSVVPFLWRGKRAALVIANDVTDRKRIEDALRESEEKYRLVVENANEIIVITYDGFVKFANKGVMTLFGVPPEALFGKHLKDLVIKRDRERLGEEYRKLTSGEEALPFYRYRMRDAKGDIRFIEVNGIPLTWEGQSCVLSFVSDITDKVHAEEEIKRRLRYEEAVAFCSQELVGSSDLNTSMGNIVEHLKGRMDVGGVFICKNVMDPLEGLCMLTICEAFADGQRPPTNFPVPDKVAYTYRSREMLDALSNGRPFGGPTKDYPRADRDVLTLIGSLSSIMIPITVSGQFWGFIGFDDYKTERVWDDQDILLLQTISSMIGTALARQEAQAALEESERRYREVVDGTNDMIYVMDYKGNFKFINNAARQLGYEPDELIGRNIYEFYASSSSNYAQELFRLQRTGTQLSGYELDIVTKDGQVRTIEFRDDLKWEGDRIVEVQGIGRDVTDRRKREERLRLVAESQEAVLDSVPAMVFFTDLSFKITWANRIAARMSGSFGGGIGGAPLLRAAARHPGAVRGLPRCGVPQVGKDRKERFRAHTLRQEPQLTTAYPVLDAEGKITGIVVTIGDFRPETSFDISQSLTAVDEEMDEDGETELFLAPLDPNYIYPFHLSIDFQKDTFIISLRWDEIRKEHLLKRLARSESAVARFIYLAARMKIDGSGWVDKDLIRAGTMDTNLNKLRSVLEESAVPFLDRFSSRMLIRSNKEEKKKVRLALSPIKYRDISKHQEFPVEEAPISGLGRQEGSSGSSGIWRISSSPRNTLSASLPYSGKTRLTSRRASISLRRSSARHRRSSSFSIPPGAAAGRVCPGNVSQESVKRGFPTGSPFTYRPFHIPERNPISPCPCPLACLCTLCTC